MRNRSRIMASMKKLDRSTRAAVLHQLCEGVSIRATARLTGVSKTTILKLVEDAGRAAAWYQDRVLQNLDCKRVQADEVWGFCGSKQTNTPAAKKATGEAGDIWLWIATCADTKLVACWHLGSRTSGDALSFVDNLASRLTRRVQLSTDSNAAYGGAVEEVFGGDIDYGQVVKVYGKVSEGMAGRYSPPKCIGAKKHVIEGRPDEKHISTSYSERNNLNVRMHSRRMTRLTNAFSRKVENHAHAMALHFLYYNFVRQHQTAADVSGHGRRDHQAPLGNE